MSYACPVLSSNVAAAPELLDETYLHTAGDASCLARQLQQIIVVPSVLKEMARNNYEKSREYLAETLNARRNAFYDSFFELCTKRKK